MAEKINQLNDKIHKEKIRQVFGDQPNNGLFQDEISLDDISFRPISDGLGINSREKNEIKFTKKADLPKNIKEISAKKITKRQEASALQEVLAYLFDFTFVVTLTLSIFSMFALVIGMSLTDVQFAIKSLNIQIALISVFFILYIAYFTLLDSVASLGKSILKIHVETATDEKSLTLKTSFYRTMISALSLCLIGIPMLFHLHDKICKTKVMRDV